MEPVNQHEVKAESLAVHDAGAAPMHIELFQGFEHLGGTVTDLGGRSILPNIQPFEADLPHQNKHMDHVHRLFGDYDHDTYERHMKNEVKASLTPEQKKEWDAEEHSLRTAMLANPPYIPDMPTHDLVTQKVTQMERDVEAEAASKLHWGPQQMQDFGLQKAELLKDPESKPGILVKQYFHQLHKSTLEHLANLEKRDPSVAPFGNISIDGVPRT